MGSSDPATPAFLQLAAHPLRWRLLAELGQGDLRVRELMERVGEPQNLVSYHLRQLRRGGLVSAGRSSFDGRDSYYHLDLERCASALTGVGTALHPALAREPVFGGYRAPVLFTCTGNSARSLIAESLLRHRTGGRVEVTSAGSHPKRAVSGNAVRVLRERYGVDVAGRRPQHLNTVQDRSFGYVISLCDKVREAQPAFPGDPELVHWSIPEPTGYPAFVRTAAEIDTRIRHLLPVLDTREDSS
ncbi:helix-turn-helix domain-containing protein [Actinomadura barringtoniae]|uniref:Helix-turn-helix domain-containing protein n=1 Tax=Actinomadura barringtoniae TaxID=1427535 RepID=A0A939P6K0_9ACTN|nr:ArsR family transcriptional regulator [Actinomadura barringtoniae]MBO2446472.1 helix-turn-helix domain-containing protein [Actinomadura barringtoniae]